MRRPLLAICSAALVAASLALTGVIEKGSGSPRVATAAFDAKCGVFPKADGVAANAPSLPDQRAWNQNISQAPVSANSDKIINYINSNGDKTLHPDWGSVKIYGIPFTVTSNKTKPVKVKFTAFGSESDKGKYRIPVNAPIEGGPKGDGDRHTLGYDKDNCKLYELYRAFPNGNKWKAEGGAIWDLKSAGLRTLGFTSADAAGLPIFPGLVRYDEVAAGEIDHALRVTFEVTRDSYILPASHCASDTKDAGAPPMGLRFRLKDSYDTSKFSGQAAVIATALKEYGLINADNGSNWFFQGSYNKNWDDDNLNQLKEIPGSAFEVIESEAPVTNC